MEDGDEETPQEFYGRMRADVASLRAKPAISFAGGASVENVGLRLVLVNELIGWMWSRLPSDYGLRERGDQVVDELAIVAKRKRRRVSKKMNQKRWIICKDLFVDGLVRLRTPRPFTAGGASSMLFRWIFLWAAVIFTMSDY